MEGLTVRWTVGDVSIHGYRALSLSIRGASALFGPEAEYIVCVNSIPIDEARRRLGPVPSRLNFRQILPQDFPSWMRDFIGPGVAEGVAWKLAPVRIAQERFELSLDNDVILWRTPRVIAEWLSSGQGIVTAEDVRPCFGKFASVCGPDPRNSGIRGLPPRFDYEASLKTVLSAEPVVTDSELDEQGLQVAALSKHPPGLVVPLSEVSICSPFPPHVTFVGSHGVHLVGLNVKNMPWMFNGLPGHKHMQAQWLAKRTEIAARFAEAEKVRGACPSVHREEQPEPEPACSANVADTD